MLTQFAKRRLLGCGDDASIALQRSIEGKKKRVEPPPRDLSLQIQEREG
jgi:hypothetical protein